VKPILLVITILFSIPVFSQRVYGVEDTSHRRRVEYNLAKEAIKVFPNPVASDLYITIKEEGLTIKSVLVYDKDGNRVIEQKLQSKLGVPLKLNMRTLQEGLYYLVIETNKQPYRMQLVKQ
jgi:hypothetical protein